MKKETVFELVFVENLLTYEQWDTDTTILITNLTHTKLESYYWLSYRATIDITLLSTINNLSY